VCFSFDCTRHVIRGSLKILFSVMWQLYVLFFEYVNWELDNIFVYFSFFCGMELFELVFLIAMLCYFCNCFLQSHYDKVAITLR
jgi:hypothetical protein